MFVMEAFVNPTGIDEDAAVATWDANLIDVRPVFRGLSDAGLAGKDIAQMLKVAPSTVSKWRRGSAKPDDATIQFLTLILADMIHGKERTLDAMEDVPLAWRLGRESELAAMRQSLLRQEVINQVLPGTAIRDGARMFKEWLQLTQPAQMRTPRPSAFRVVA